MKKKVKQFEEFVEGIRMIHKLGVSSVAIIAGLIWFFTYFTPASAFESHVRQQRIDKLQDITIKYEQTYKCYMQTCQDKMDPELYFVYFKFKQRIEDLKGDKK